MRRPAQLDEDHGQAYEWKARVLKDITDSVSEMLVWTADYLSAHQNGKLPVLDICTWTVEMDRGTFLQYEFYSKQIL